MAVGCHGRGTKEDGCLFIFFKRDPQENNTFHFGSYSIGWNKSKLNSIIFLRGEQQEHWWTAQNINTHHTLPRRALSHHFSFSRTSGLSLCSGLGWKWSVCTYSSPWLSPHLSDIPLPMGMISVVLYYPAPRCHWNYLLCLWQKFCCACGVHWMVEKNFHLSPISIK